MALNNMGYKTFTRCEVKLKRKIRKKHEENSGPIFSIIPQFDGLFLLYIYLSDF